MRGSTHKMLALVAGAAAAVLALGACGSGDNSSDGGSDAPTTLTMGTVVAPHTFSAAEANWAHEAGYMQAVYDTLLDMAPDGTVVPSLATSFEWDEDKTTLTLELRDDVEFSDGSAFNAEVAVGNLIRFRDGTSSNASYLASMADAVAVDTHTVQITLSEPDPAFLFYLTQNAGLQESAEAFGNEDIATRPVGSGPYELDTAATVADSSYVFNKRPDYWNPDHQHYDTIVINVYDSQTAILNAVLNGQLDATALIDVSTNDEIEGAGYTLNPHQIETWQGLTLADRDGQLSPELADVRVRQAINYALDRETMLDSSSGGVGRVTSSIFPTTSPSYDESLDDYYPYDPDKARQLLAEAGYADGFTLPMPTASAFGEATYALISGQLADVGITVEASDFATEQLLPTILSASFPAYFMQLQEDPTDWQIVRFIIASDATWNPFHTQDPIVDDLIHTIQYGSEAEAITAGQDLNRYLVEEAWFAPFHRPTFSYASSPKVDVEMVLGGAMPNLWDIKPVAG